MADNRTREERSRNMGAVRNKGSKPELMLLGLIKKSNFTGWRRNYRRAYGTPDLAFPRLKIAIFVDGCFWHGCECKTIPDTNRTFWLEKIEKNVTRDEIVNERLGRYGWSVWRVKEHELRRKNESWVLTNLQELLAKQPK